MNSTGGALSGATFEIRTTADDVLVQTITQDTNGVYTATGLTPGESYYLVEVSAPANYILNPTKFEFEIPTEASYDYTTQPIYFEYELINYQGSATFTKVNTSQQGLQGAEFTLYRVVGTTKTQVRTGITSNANGVVSITGLGSGNYELVETTAPSGYLRNNTPKTFTITDSTSVALPTINLGSLINYQLTIPFNKVDQFGNALTGASFKVVYRNGSELPSSIDYTLKVVDGSKFTVTGLPVGNYRIKETVTPTGYVENTGLFFDVTQAMMNIYATAADHLLTPTDNLPMTDFTLKNYKANVAINKRGENNAVLTDVVFAVFNDDGTGQPVTGTRRELVVVNSIYKLSDTDLLAPGNYILVEEVGSTGYIRNTKLEKFTVESTHSGEYTITRTLNNYKGAVSIKKVNSTRGALSGATFEIRTTADDVLVQTITQDTNGVYTATGLTPGESYYLVEVSAPANYILNPTKFEFEIPTEASYDYTTQPIYFEYELINYQGSATFTKVNTSQQGLQGAEFTLYRVVGTTKTQVRTGITSNANGVVSITGLGSGNYELVETTAPSGYLRNNTPKTFTITDSTSVALPTINLGSLINYQLTIPFNKVDQFGNALTGASFKVVYRNGSELPSSIDYTLKVVDGSKFTVTGLPVGNYRIKETVTPTGYVENTGLFFDVTQAMMNIYATAADHLLTPTDNLPMTDFTLKNYKA